MNVEVIQKLIDDHTSGRSDNSRKIYLLLVFALWYNIFIALRFPETDSAFISSLESKTT